MLAANSRTLNTPEGGLYAATSLIQHSESTTLVPIGGDTNKARVLTNQVVCKALHFFKVIWQFLWLHKPEELFGGENSFVVDAHYFFPQIVDTLTYLPHVRDMAQVLENGDIRRSIMKALDVLSVFTVEQEFKDFYRGRSQSLYLQVVIPFLKITEAERETMGSDVKEFCNLIEDVCGDQKSTTIKVTTAKLLTALCANVPGFYAQMMCFAMDAITRSLKEQVATNLSFTANSPDDTMTEQATTQD